MTEGRLAPEEVRTRTFTKGRRGVQASRCPPSPRTRCRRPGPPPRTGPATEEARTTSRPSPPKRSRRPLPARPRRLRDGGGRRLPRPGRGRAPNEPPANFTPLRASAPPRSGLFPPRPFPEVRVTEARAPGERPRRWRQRWAGPRNRPPRPWWSGPTRPIAVPDADRAVPWPRSQPPAAGVRCRRPRAGQAPGLFPRHRHRRSLRAEPAPAASTPPDAPPEDPASTGWQQPAPSPEPTPPEPTPPEAPRPQRGRSTRLFLRRRCRPRRRRRRRRAATTGGPSRRPPVDAAADPVGGGDAGFDRGAPATCRPTSTCSWPRRPAPWPAGTARP